MAPDDTKKLLTISAIGLLGVALVLIFQWQKVNQLSNIVATTRSSGLTVGETQNLFASGQIPYLKSVIGRVDKAAQNQFTIVATVPDFNASWPDKNNPPTIQKTYIITVQSVTKIFSADVQDINKRSATALNAIQVGSYIEVTSPENIWNQSQFIPEEVTVF